MTKPPVNLNSNVVGVAEYTEGRLYPGTDVPRYPLVPQQVTSVGQSHVLRIDGTRDNPRDVDGWRSPSPYSLYRDTIHNWDGTILIWKLFDYNNHWRATWSGRLPSGALTTTLPPFDTSVPDVTYAMIARAEVEALNKLKQQNVNYTVAVAEARKSMSLIAGNFWQLFDSYRAARKGNWKKVLKSLNVRTHTFKAGSKSTSSRWLELQYGWLPLLSDAYGAYLDIQQGMTRDLRISVQRTIKAPIKDFDTSTVGNWGKIPIRYRHGDSSQYGVKVRLDYTLNTLNAALAAQVGVTNPALVAWELVPFSFVVDWALPIGNFLDAWDADFGLTFKGGSRTVFKRCERTAKASFAGPRKANSVGAMQVEASMSHFSMTRTVYTSSPVPTPYWKNPVSAKHAANALALLVGLLK